MRPPQSAQESMFQMRPNKGILAACLVGGVELIELCLALRSRLRRIVAEGSFRTQEGQFAVQLVPGLSLIESQKNLVARRQLGFADCHVICLLSQPSPETVLVRSRRRFHFESRVRCGPPVALRAGTRSWWPGREDRPFFRRARLGPSPSIV